MNKLKIAKIAVSNVVYTIDFLYSYLVPEGLCDIKVGQIVLVPFGRGSKERLGIVYELTDATKEDANKISNLKFVKEILNKEITINSELLALSKFMKERYFCTFFDAIKAIAPISVLVKKQKDTYILSKTYKEKVLNLNILDELSKRIINYLSLKIEASADSLKKHLKINDIQKNINYLLKEEIILLGDRKNSPPHNLINSYVKLNIGLEDHLKKFTKSQEAVVTLIKKRKEICIKEILYLTGVSKGVINRLLKNKVIKFCENTNNVANDAHFSEPKLKCADIILTKEQKIAFDSIYELYKKEKFYVHLLFGITGSGKTSVYMKLIDIAFAQNKGVIVLLPEIALTSQVISKFYERYGSMVAVYHSALTNKERAEQFKKVLDGTYSIVVGTRSAVFLPVKNLGLIIVDEEQEDSYKSEHSPRYNAKEIAKYKCYFSNCLLLLSSATPSVESFYLAKSGKYSLSKLTNRYNGASLPEVKIVDMGKELKEGNNSLFSSFLIEKLYEILNKNMQAILLINRRGYNTFLICRNCRKVITCPKCSVSLVYHNCNRRLVCHYCGYSVENLCCPYCKSKEIKYSGIGTQKIEQDLKKLIPAAKILRMDSDTAFTKEKYEKSLKDFKEKKYNVMLGTQMVAKGLDFKDVTLVSILCADYSLYNSDYRGYERSFSLFTQVIGRAGRNKENKGMAIIQTFTPENPIIKFATKQDYEHFFETEILLRKALMNSPFVEICAIIFKGKFEHKVKTMANEFFSFLGRLAEQRYKTLSFYILRPSSANVLKVNNNYRYRIIIKYKNKKLFRSFLQEALLIFEKNFNKGNVSIFADSNPTMLI